VVLISSAGHIGAGYHGRTNACREAVLRGHGLHHIAHYANGVYEFAVDVLADPALADELAGASVARKRADCVQVGRELSYRALSLDRSLQEVQSGALIRTVLQSAKGTLFCNSVLPREHIVALTLDRSARSRPEVPLSQLPLVQDADRAAAELVTTLRDELSQGSQNPGGWSTRKPIDATAVAGAGSGGPLRPAALEKGREDPLGDACRAAVSTEDLHYIAHFRGSELRFSVDLLDDRALSRFFLRISSPARRKFYADLGRQFNDLARQLAQVVRPAIGGPLSRIVLDVEQGAIYFYRLTAEHHLLGVTLDQRRVSEADDKIAQLAVQARKELEPR
jgi:hypothetical protein